MHFDKMEGLGNDFVVLDGSVEVNPDLVRRLSDRRRGIGADGVLQVTLADDGVNMSYWNADGSAAEMCGNGLRCVARYAFDRGMVDEKEFAILTPRGPLRVELNDDPRVELGPVELGNKFEFDGQKFHWVSLGNPHAVTLVSDLGEEEVASIGRSLEQATPGGTNVEFVRVLDHSRIEMRVWERGVGETLACGSGMVAAVAVSRHLGLTSAEVSVTVPGGVGTVELTPGSAWLTGPAHYVFSGDL